MSAKVEPGIQMDNKFVLFFDICLKGFYSNGALQYVLFLLNLRTGKEVFDIMQQDP